MTRILVVDLETSPNVADVWGLWGVNVSLNQLLQSGRVICFAARWHGEKSIAFHSEWVDGREQMLAEAYHLFDEADVVVGWNSSRFDVPWLQGEWARMGWTPPSPFAQVDLCTVAKRTFRFPSNKLEYCATELLGKGKVKHQGHGLWTAVLAGDEKARAKMARYNIADVRLTDEMFVRLRPWVKNLPNPYVHGDVERAESCPDCGSTELEPRGYAYTAVSQYRRFRCKECGRWSRGTRRHFGAKVRGAA